MPASPLVPCDIMSTSVQAEFLHAAPSFLATGNALVAASPFLRQFWRFRNWIYVIFSVWCSFMSRIFVQQVFLQPTSPKGGLMLAVTCEHPCITRRGLMLLAVTCEHPCGVMSAVLYGQLWLMASQRMLLSGFYSRCQTCCK